MIPIHPITKENCQPHYGYLVCALMNDGSRHIGILSRFANGMLILNEAGQDENNGNDRKYKGKHPAAKAKKGTTARPAPVDPVEAPEGMNGFPQFPVPPNPDSFNPFGDPVTLDPAAITLLFQVVL